MFPSDEYMHGWKAAADAAQVRIRALEAALSMTQDLVQDAIQNGYDPGMGEWCRPLQDNQEAIRAVLRKP